MDGLETVAEHASGDLAGLTTYRLYMQTAHPADRVVAAVGDDEFTVLDAGNVILPNPFGSNNPEGDFSSVDFFSPMWPTTVGSQSAWTALLPPLRGKKA